MASEDSYWGTSVTTPAFSVNSPENVSNTNSAIISTITTSTSSPSTVNVPVITPPQHQFHNSRVSMEKSGPVPIPVKNRELSPLSAEAQNPRSAGRSSVEELNQEIERLVCVGLQNNSCDPPEGHRAPIAELFSSQHRRTVSTQTPSSVDSSGDSRGSRISDESSCPSSAEHSRPDSPASPVHIISGRPVERSHDPGYSTSPEINTFLTREPPDGCEKVKIVNEEEARRRNLSHLVLAPCPQKPCNPGFVLLPSQSSAFLPLYKNNCYPNSPLESPSNSSFNQLYEKRMNDYNSKSHFQ